MSWTNTGCDTGMSYNYGYVVDACPLSKEEATVEATRLRCGTDENGRSQYVCVPNQNLTALVEFCYTKTIIALYQTGHCLRVIGDGFLDQISCKKFTKGCPAKPFRSTDLYNYPACHNLNKEKRCFIAEPSCDAEVTVGAISTSNLGISNAPTVYNTYSTVDVEAIFIAISCFLVLLGILAPVFLLCRYRNIHSQRHTDSEAAEHEEECSIPLTAASKEMNIKEQLNILNKYLVCILEKELKVQDLKEKSLSHSKSLQEHFTQAVLEDLQSVKKVNDYSTLDISLVLTLLRNFCVNIIPPERGWGYEPPDHEQTLGADIERIRSYWNKYCDKSYEFEKLDDMAERMKHLCRTQCVGDYQELQNKSQEEMKKIPSIKLNPDCFVKEGIVITDGIKSALRSLEKGNVVIFKGAIGCGKTHALKSIQNKYKEKGWKVRWMEESLLSLEKEDLKNETIVICDNLFGSYSCNTFTSNKTLVTESILKNIQEKPGNSKIAVGIHQHVFDEVKLNVNLTFIQNKNITVDLDNISKSEMLIIFKEQQKDGHCKTDPRCRFNNTDATMLTGILLENQSQFGTPFLSLMCCIQHDFFTDNVFIRDPLQSLIQRFRKMENESVDYHSLVYLMCVRKHKYGDELARWAGELDADLNDQTIQNISIKLPEIIRVENGIASLRHESLAVALFKATSYFDTIFLQVVKNCEIKIMFQLLRPADSCDTEFSCGFAYPEKNSTQRNIGKQIVKRFVDTYKSNWGSIKHPLQHHALFTEKFEHYLTHRPKEK